MRKDTHMLFGCLCGILCAKGLTDTGTISGILESTEVIIATSIGALIPDVDHPQSFLGKRLALISRPTAAVGKYCGNKGKQAGSKGSKKFWTVMGRAFSHRGMFHSPLLYSILGVCAWFLVSMPLFKLLTTFVCMGCLSHILADMFNPSGIAIFQPFSWKRISLARITTGSGGEAVFKLATIFLCLLSSAWSFGWLQGIENLIKN